MKKIISTCIALMVSAACSISAFAMEVPTNTTIQDLNGVRQYIKIYTVAPDTDPQSLIDDVFEYDGYTYTYSSMTKEEHPYSEKEHHTETVTADTEKSDLSVVLKALSPSIEYDDGEFRGTLYLDHSTISTVASGYADSFRIGNATLPQSRVRAKLRRLDGMILREAESKLRANQERNVKNSTAYTMAVLFNCIAESESDLMIDPYLNTICAAV